MSRLTKISLVIFGVMIVLALIVGILVKTLVTPQKIRNTLVPLAERSLNRKVTLGDIHIGLFSGVSLSDLQVRQRKGGKNFIAIKSMDLHYRFLPLLTGKVLIDHISLVQPVIIVTKYPNGTYNFSDLLGNKVAGSKEQTMQAKQTAPTKTKPQAQPKASLNLLVSTISLTGGHLLFIDQDKPGRTLSRYSLDNLSLEAKQITLNKPFPVELSASLNGAKIALSGSYDVKNQSANFNLKLDQLDVTEFSPYFSKSLPGRLGSGALSLKVKGDITPGIVKAKGKVTLDKIDLSLKDLPMADMRQAKLEIDSSLSYKMTDKTLKFSSLLLKFNDIPVRTVGNISLSGKEPNMTMALFLDDLDLQKLNQGLPARMAANIKDYNLSGQVNALVELAGKPSSGLRLLRKADLRFKNVRANFKGIQTGINGNIDFSGQQVQAKKMALNLADQPVDFSFAAKDVFSKHITGNFQVQADTLDFNNLLKNSEEKASVPDASAEKPEAAQTARKSPNQDSAAAQPAPQEKIKPPKEIGPFAIPAEISGTIIVNKGVYKQLPIDHIKVGVLLQDNHLRISQADCGLAGGTLRASTDLDMGVKGFTYNGKLDLNNLQLAVLDNGLFPDSDQRVTGILNSKNTFTGHGTVPESLLKAMQVTGLTTITQGQVTGSPMVNALTNFLGLQNFDKLEFDSMQSRYVMQNAVVSLNGGLDSPKLKLAPQGTVAINGPINLGLNARLAPEIMSQLSSDNNLKQAMTDDNGWGIMPLKLVGTMKSPRIALDSNALQKQAVGKARQELQKQLLKKISPDKTDQKADKNKQLLDSALKGLFGN